MTKKLIVAVLATPFAILALATLICAVSSWTPVSDEEYAVYSALLQVKVASAVPGHDAALRPEMLVRGRTRRISWAPLRVIFLTGKRSSPRPSAPWSAEFNLSTKSWLEANLEPKLRLPIRYRIVRDEDGAELDAGFEPYVQLGRVGFDANRETAIVYYDLFCGLCGEGGYAILVRNGDTWTLSEDVNLWVS